MELRAHEMGGSLLQPIYLYDIAWFLSPAFAGFKPIRALTWGLRPRLYAGACFAGFKTIRRSNLGLTPQALCWRLLRRLQNPRLYAGTASQAQRPVLRSISSGYRAPCTV